MTGLPFKYSREGFHAKMQREFHAKAVKEQRRKDPLRGFLFAGKAGRREGGIVAGTNGTLVNAISRVAEMNGNVRGARGNVRDTSRCVRDTIGRVRDSKGNVRGARDNVRDTSRRVRDTIGRVRDSKGNVRGARGNVRDTSHRVRDTSTHVSGIGCAGSLQ